MGNTVTIKVGGGGTSSVATIDLQTGVPVAATLSFASDNPGVCTVDPVNGTFTAVAVGSANISVSASANGFTHSDSASVTVAQTDTGDFSVTLTLNANP